MSTAKKKAAPKLGHINRPKQYEVLKRTTRELTGIELDPKHQFKFNQSGMFKTNDAGVARDLVADYRPHVNVAEIDRPKRAGDVSRSFFGGLPEMPWKKKRGKRNGHDSVRRAAGPV